jgi:L-lactate dehydrogenase (cytochrome)
MSEVVKHNHAADCWLVVHDQVFAMTVFVNNHPGGQVWAPKCGQNATELFEDNLTNFEATILDDYYVGDLHP